jgi:hypothetical protein
VPELEAGEEATETQPRNLFDERDRHPYADRTGPDRGRPARRGRLSEEGIGPAPSGAGGRRPGWTSCTGRSRRPASCGRPGTRRPAG